jgi:hypothetical protein
MNFYETALDSIGGYPKSTTKDGIITERTEWQEGWNACLSKIIDNTIAFEKWFYALEDNQRTLLEKVEDYRYLALKDGEVKCFINCNDFFWWACGDFEDLDDWNLLEQSLNDAGDDGCLLYCARKRKMRPQGAFYKYLKAENHHWFDECGEKREINFGNPE